ncbi:MULTISPECIES: retropepsin-like aspartic protease family protein [Paracoccaceae]|jgi:aspartyl protease family protein|uniref:retropepsin-like aspartic protease family protein n=1 Tax=Rhodobacterales TaxID=204455 RepID=UPI001B1A73CA|nr:TIGR02281 family clan AA aspartic protease [Boseongicola sp. H5]MBO6601859.1 TIGR02281 family clan AA aspartic protease [Roseicyclus sp.]MBO6625762.1 TIGR02281 family clan AA aspartic protease [Roseicyclus sp.]MBO6922067.1 TIGR02281 family clan AA aspartic protease [Roseicyclus sp.]
MSGDQIASFIYLGLFGTVIAGYFLVANRHQMGKMAQQAAIWVFIFLGAIVAVGVWGDIRGTVLPRQSTALDGAVIEVPRAPDGHYYLMLDINETPVRFVVDTGASDMVLTRQDAVRVGVDMDRLVFSGRAMTANGLVETAPVRLDQVALGGVVETDVPAVVNSGAMAESLLGMTYLNRFDRIEITGGELVLTR